MNTINASITADDLSRATIALVWRAPSIWKGLAAWTLIQGAVVLNFRGLPRDSSGWLFLLVAALIAALATVFLITAADHFRRRGQLKEGEGQVGEHEFTLKDEGFFERTSANQTLTAWHVIRSVRENKNFIFVELPGHLHHIIPKRAFATEADLSAFVARLKDHVRKAA